MASNWWECIPERLTRAWLQLFACAFMAAVKAAELPKPVRRLRTAKSPMDGVEGNVFSYDVDRPP